MLRRLDIEDYALVARAEISFSEGATTFTGETGSGKSMILGALSFVLGERANAEIVRRGRPRAAVSLAFEPDGQLRERFNADGFALDPDEDAILSRELSANGKSSLRLNGRPATASYVRDIALDLVDFVGQHEAQRLVSPSYHLDALDRFAGAEALAARRAVEVFYGEARALESAIETADRDEQALGERAAHAAYALEEIRGAGLVEGEDERLSQQRAVAMNAQRITAALHTAHEALDGEEGSAADALGTAAAALQQAGHFAEAYAQLAQSAALLQNDAGELSARVAREIEAIDIDPAAAAAIDARLEIVETLKRKYGGSIAAVLHAATSFESLLDSRAASCADRAARTVALAAARESLQAAANTLSMLRRAAAERLRTAVESELADLALSSARFAVRFEDLAGVHAKGAQTVEFLFAANAGEELRPLGRVASGGELSRLLLAIVLQLAGAHESAALVFDEIDAGIGGATATAVGGRLGRLAGSTQVVCVTHLAQIAAWSDAHYVLEKRDAGGIAEIGVRAVKEPPQRVAELARMLSGEAHDIALEHARELLRRTGERRGKMAAR